MSLIKGCNELIDKYDMDESDKTFLLNLYEECKQNYEQNCIDHDALEYYCNISNYIVNYVNDHNLSELKDKLKNLFNPLNVDGIYTPNNLYSSDELSNIYKDIKKRDFEITKSQTDDEPTNP